MYRQTPSSGSGMAQGSLAGQSPAAGGHPWKSGLQRLGVGVCHCQVPGTPRRSGAATAEERLQARV